MKMTDMLKMTAPVLKMLSRHGVFMDDWKYVEAYEQFRRMREIGVKYDEAIRIVAEETSFKARTLERAFKRLRKEC